MTLKRRVDAYRALPPALRPARWHRFHTVGASVAVIIGLLILFFPANAASAAGRILLDEHNALYMRAIVTGLALWVGFVIRGRPWWDMLICMLIASFASGQMLRAIYTPEVGGIPAALMWANLACTIYLFVLAWRPSVYERFEDLQAENRRLKEALGEPL